MDAFTRMNRFRNETGGKKEKQTRCVEMFSIVQNRAHTIPNTVKVN